MRLIYISIAMAALVGAMWCLSVKPSDIKACEKATGHSADYCLQELVR